MNSRALSLLLISGALVGTTALRQAQGHSYTPPNGFIPDSITAVRVAAAILYPIYGERQIRSELPLVASQSGGVWTVHGSLRPQSLGGVAQIWLTKRDARVIRVTHGQ